MTPDDLKAHTKIFAVDVIRFAKAIPKDQINEEIDEFPLWLEMLVGAGHLSTNPRPRRFGQKPTS